jgi:hypothetical protein
MADEKTFPVRITRENYTFRNERIPVGTIVEVTDAQFRDMTSVEPPFAEKVKAAEAKAAGSEVVPLAAPEADAAATGRKR